MIGIDDNIIKVLLEDITTRNNITLGNDDYEGYKSTDEISIEMAKTFQPRAFKNKDLKKDRTKKKAEIFTPPNIVEKMNNQIEEEIKDLGLDEYIRFKWLEITCGEGAYITSRYNATTGEAIKIEERVGFLDKKLYAVNNYFNNEDSWRHSAVMALTSCYGFEYQGDNLFLTRLNVLKTIKENYYHVFKEELSNDYLLDIANIIKYNFFQMDGIKYKTPNTDKNTLIVSWEIDKIIEFKDLVGVADGR